LPFASSVAGFLGVHLRDREGWRYQQWKSWKKQKEACLAISEVGYRRYDNGVWRTFDEHQVLCDEKT
jgi:hypothetical protein